MPRERGREHNMNVGVRADERKLARDIVIFDPAGKARATTVDKKGKDGILWRIRNTASPHLEVSQSLGQMALKAFLPP